MPSMALIFDAIDEDITNLFQTCTGMDTSLWLAFTKESIRLPIRLKGYGLHRAMDRRSSQHVGATGQSIIPLIDRKDNRGSVILGRLNLTVVIALFGAGSFNHPYPTQWQGVLTNSRPSDNITNRLRLAWIQLTTKFQAIVTSEQLLAPMRLLLKQDIA